MADQRKAILEEVANGLNKVWEELDQDALHNSFRYQGKHGITVIARWWRHKLGIEVSGLRGPVEETDDGTD